MRTKLTTALIALAAALMLTSCGYQGGYRYHCQDPANWGSKECVPPECKATGMCTNDLLGFDPNDSNTGTISSTTTEGR